MVSPFQVKCVSRCILIGSSVVNWILLDCGAEPICMNHYILGEEECQRRNAREKNGETISLIMVKFVQNAESSWAGLQEIFTTCAGRGSVIKFKYSPLGERMWNK